MTGFSGCGDLKCSSTAPLASAAGLWLRQNREVGNPGGPRLGGPTGLLRRSDREFASGSAFERAGAGDGVRPGNCETAAPGDRLQTLAFLKPRRPPQDRQDHRGLIRPRVTAGLGLIERV